MPLTPSQWRHCWRCSSRCFSNLVSLVSKQTQCIISISAAAASHDGLGIAKGYMDKKGVLRYQDLPALKGRQETTGSIGLMWFFLVYALHAEWPYFHKTTRLYPVRFPGKIIELREELLRTLLANNPGGAIHSSFKTLHVEWKPKIIQFACPEFQIPSHSISAWPSHRIAATP